MLFSSSQLIVVLAFIAFDEDDADISPANVVQMSIRSPIRPYRRLLLMPALAVAERGGG
jgi:hypothetical protein